MRTLQWMGVLALGISACSSKERVDVNAGRGDALRSVQIYRKDESSALQNAALGTLPFFYGSSRGLNVRGVKWNRPVTSENPGADCDLTYNEGKGTNHFFRCIIKEGNTHIIVTLQEDLVEGRRLLRRIFMDGKGESLVNQWSSSLERIGYRKAPPVKGVTSRYVSPNNETVADLIWVPASKSATMRLSPRL